MKNIAQRHAQARLRIVSHAAEAFFQNGLREVKMDDIAKALSMSKRTLYQLYANKEELIIASLEYKENCNREFLESERLRVCNCLELILIMLREQMRQVAACSVAYFHDLQLFPQVMAYFEGHRNEQVATIATDMEAAAAEGLLRTELNYSLIAKSLYAQFFTQIEHSDLKSYSLRDFYCHVVLTVLRGCATERGMQQIDDFIAEQFSA